MNFTWDEVKRRANITKHCLDFADAAHIFESSMVLFADDRADYSEQRMIGISLLDALMLLIVRVESEDNIRIISMRKVDSNESDLY